MLILPTKRRPNNLIRFIHYYYLTKATIPVWVIFDEADAFRYNHVKTPEHWKRLTVAKGTPLGGIFKKIFEKYPNEPFYGMVADDVVPETMEWDRLLLEACMPDKIAWGADGIQDVNLPVHPFIGGDLIRKLGWWSAPDLKHWFVDNVWKDLTVALGNGAYLPDVKMTHFHMVNGKAPNDRTYEDQPAHGVDRAVYIDFLDNKFPAILERLGIKAP